MPGLSRAPTECSGWMETGKPASGFLKWRVFPPGTMAQTLGTRECPGVPRGRWAGGERVWPAAPGEVGARSLGQRPGRSPPPPSAVAMSDIAAGLGQGHRTLPGSQGEAGPGLGGCGWEARAGAQGAGVSTWSRSPTECALPSGEAAAPPTSLRVLKGTWSSWLPST